MTRTDRSRQWFVLHPGIPLPFKISGEVTIVTDSEMKLIERFQKATAQPKLQYFVMPNRYFNSTILMEIMTAIRDAAQTLP